MNRVDKEFNKIATETVNNLLNASTEKYEEIKLTLLSYQTDDVKIRDYLQEIFKYTDMHRPMFLEMKEGVLV